MREAEPLAERLNDDRRRGRVCAFMLISHAQLGEQDEALWTGTRALEIAGRLGDLRLRLLIANGLVQMHYPGAEYERVVELTTDNLAALPADWVYDYFERPVPVSVLDRAWLVMSLAQMGRFAEATEYEAEATRLAKPTERAFTLCMAHRAAGWLAHVNLGSRPWLCTCSATSLPIPTGSMPRLARPTMRKRWCSPSRAACAPSSPTATSASASCSGARASVMRRGSISPRRRRCTARW